MWLTSFPCWHVVEAPNRVKCWETKECPFYKLRIYYLKVMSILCNTFLSAMLWTFRTIWISPRWVTQWYGTKIYLSMNIHFLGLNLKCYFESKGVLSTGSYCCGRERFQSDILVGILFLYKLRVSRDAS